MSLLLIYYFSFFSLLPSFVSRFRSFLEFEFPGIYQDKCMHGRRERGRDSLKRFLYFFKACIRALALNVPINDHPVFFFFLEFLSKYFYPGINISTDFPREGEGGGCKRFLGKVEIF